MGERHVDAAAVERTITVYGDLLYRIALHHLKTREDAEDVAHDVFIKWLEKAPAFSSDEHEKAWLIRTTINACTDFRRRAARRLTVALDACPEPPAPETGSVLEDVLALPPPLSTLIFLHYYEGYSIREIAALLGKTESSIQSRLYRARQKLKQEREESVNEYRTLPQRSK
ncbi:MAG: RNA polymerase sigma factor [Clostridiales bacterium]|nr:RNA polymerase sigma factor [Clostridiales bacterium]